MMILKYFMYEAWLLENEIDLYVWLMKSVSYIYSNILDMKKKFEERGNRA